MATDKLIRRSGLVHAIAVQGTGLETANAWTGVPSPGETLTGGTSSATAKYAAFESGTKVMVTDVSGTFTAGGETVTGAISGATLVLDANTPATEYSGYITVPRLKNTFRWSDSRGVETITDFDTAENDFFDQITNGRTGTIEGEGWADLSDYGIQAILGAYRTNATVKWKVTRTTIDGTSIPADIRSGFFSDVTVVDNENSVAEYSFSFAVSAVETS
jgi:hypothetical protein